MRQKRYQLKQKKIFKSMVWLVVRFGLEEVPISINRKPKMEPKVVALKMLRFSLEWARRYKARNQYIRETTLVQKVCCKVRKARLCRFGYVKRYTASLSQGFVCALIRKKEDRLKFKFMDGVKQDMRKMMLTETEPKGRSRSRTDLLLVATRVARQKS